MGVSKELMLCIMKGHFNMNGVLDSAEAMFDCLTYNETGNLKHELQYMKATTRLKME